MSEKIEVSSENMEGVEIAEKLSELLGEKAVTPFYSNLIRALRRGGKEQCKIFCWNEFDKFRDRPDLISFLEREVFDAGDDGLGAETPWNMTRRRKAKNQ
ncbi:MAG: hypothetical protein AAB372_03485 [Patescibacteria group bacterium]